MVTARSASSPLCSGFDQPADGGQRVLGIDALAVRHVGGGGGADGRRFGAGDRRGGKLGQRLEQLGRDLARHRARR